MIKLNTTPVKGFMLLLHLAAIPVGIAVGMWLFDTLSCGAPDSPGGRSLRRSRGGYNMAEATQLSGEQLVDILKLINEADSVELKLTVPDADSRRTLAALKIDPLEAQIRQVVFFDTPDLD